MSADRSPEDDLVEDQVVAPLRRMPARPDDVHAARLAAGIEARLDALARPPRWRSSWRRAWATAAAVLLVGAGVALGAMLARPARAPTIGAAAVPEPTTATARRERWSGERPARAPDDIAAASPPTVAPPPLSAELRGPARSPIPARTRSAAPAAASLGPPDEVEAAYAAAERLMRIGATAEARAALLDLAERHNGDPRTEPALIDLARLATGAGQREEAQRLLREYLRLYPHGTFAAQAEARLGELR